MHKDFKLEQELSVANSTFHLVSICYHIQDHQNATGHYVSDSLRAVEGPRAQWYQIDDSSESRIQTNTAEASPRHQTRRIDTPTGGSLHAHQKAKRIPNYLVYVQERSPATGIAPTGGEGTAMTTTGPRVTKGAAAARKRGEAEAVGAGGTRRLDHSLTHPAWVRCERKADAPPGLENLGNTCYINSLLQALTAINEIYRRPSCNLYTVAVITFARAE